ncbi:hypothetical protein TUST1-182_00805 [Vibrio phage ICP1_2006_C]|nr:hypothetical protein TUST1-182_00805 [Vibrio phage ICP1_2006_C]
MRLTKRQQEFIGSTFPTPEGGILTVTGVVGKSSSNNAIFGLECSICSRDLELWPKGSISSTKGSLMRGYTPCGCAKNPNWTEGQNLIRVKRECSKRGYKFHGWWGKYKGIETKLNLENPITTNCWQSTNMNSFFNGSGDPVIGRKKTVQAVLISDKQHIEDFIKAGFTEGYKFWRSERLSKEGYKRYWNYTCSTCSSDEYVEAGLCSGVFESPISGLKVGQKSCRCSETFRWKQEHREYQIKKVCKEGGLIFTGWDREYKNAFSKFNWVCAEGHTCATTIGNFLTKSSRCPVCNNIKQKANGIGYGYYPHRTEERDHLYVIRFKKDNVIKVGRAFDVNERLQMQSTSLLKISNHSINDIEILDILTGTHQEVYDLEQTLHGELTEAGFHMPLDWTQEAFREDCEGLLFLLLKRTGIGSDRDCNIMKTTLNDIANGR